MAKLAALVLARPVSIMILFSLAILMAVAGLRYFEVNFDIRKNMGLKVPYVNRLDQVCKSPLGALYSYNLVVEFADENMAREPDNLKKLDLLEQEVITYPLTKKNHLHYRDHQRYEPGASRWRRCVFRHSRHPGNGGPDHAAVRECRGQGGRKMDRLRIPAPAVDRGHQRL